MGTCNFLSFILDGSLADMMPSCILFHEKVKYMYASFFILGQSSGNVLYSGFQNRRNYWLEYSTPPTTLFPDYEEYDMYGTSTTPVPGPYFIEPFKNHSIKERPLGTAAHLNCRVGDLLENQVMYTGFIAYWQELQRFILASNYMHFYNFIFVIA